MWLAQRDELAGSARIIVPDLRGFGRSVELPPAQSIDDYADDVVALLDELRIERATVVGLSMGGYVALALARRAPHRLADWAWQIHAHSPTAPKAERVVIRTSPW